MGKSAWGHTDCGLVLLVRGLELVHVRGVPHPSKSSFTCLFAALAATTPPQRRRIITSSSSPLSEQRLVIRIAIEPPPALRLLELMSAFL